MPVSSSFEGAPVDRDPSPPVQNIAAAMACLEYHLMLSGADVARQRAAADFTKPLLQRTDRGSPLDLCTVGPTQGDQRRDEPVPRLGAKRRN